MVNAIFLGSFDPPHLGHANVIMSVLNSDISKSIKSIHIIPAHQNPNKKKSTPILYRYYMSKMMFEQLSNETTNVIVNDLEFKHNWEYTYDMLEYLNNGNDKTIGDDFLWILTEETYQEILKHCWYKSEEILLKYENRMIIVGDLKPEIGKYASQILPCKDYVSLMSGFTMHSTDIRNYIKEHKNIELYCNKQIYSLIKENNLYDYMNET